jgi:hypothetical protein
MNLDDGTRGSGNGFGHLLWIRHHLANEAADFRTYENATRHALDIARLDEAREGLIDG